MKFFHKSHHQQAADRIRAYKEFYEFNKTVLHGFPANPSCLAYSNEYNLLAIGTKTGLIQIYGKPGVEFHFDLESDVEVIRLNFVPNRAQLVALCSDQSLHLLQMAHQIDEPSVLELYKSDEFVEDDTNRIITSLSISPCADLIFIGTKAADIYLLDSRDLKCNKIMKQDTILKAVSDEPKLKPGSVEAVEEHAHQKGNILIGFSRSLVVLWNYENSSLVNFYKIDQQLESLSWNNDGLHFITSHNDGSYITWNCKLETHLSHNSSKSPYGPFPCKAITKILWNTAKNREFLIFGGGMPRASYGDKEVVSIIFQTSESSTEKNQVLDFTSKIVDFALITSEENIPKALVVLVEEELVVIDLTLPDWPQYKLPYLCCLHSSPVTCSQHYTNVESSIFAKLVKAGSCEDVTMKYSPNAWPISGGINKYRETDGDEVLDLLITGHEDGTVRFWNASTVSLKHIYTLSTSKLFNNPEDDMIANIDCDETDLEEGESEWPPFKKVGHFDPYSDDPRLAVRKIAFCTSTGLLALGGTAGQVIVLELKDKAEQEVSMSTVEMKFISETEGFIWKSHSPLNVNATRMKLGPGFQPSTMVQVLPPAALTALTLSTQWSIIAAGTAHGFGLFDLTNKKVLVAKTTLKPSNLIAGAGGDALITRRKSFKKSLRESFRRLRRGRSQKSKRNITTNQSKIQEIRKGNSRVMNKNDDAFEARPVERQIEARTESTDSMINSMVRYLYFCSASIISNTLHPTFWIGTNAGTVFVYVRTGSDGSTWQLAKEVQIKHKAPIIFIRLLDSNGIPIFENNYTEGDKLGQTRVLICSEEQFKLFNLSNFKTLHKFKLTAHEGARVRKMELGFFTHRSQKEQSEHSLLCLTNLGDVNIFATNDFKRKFQHNFIKKEDINGITSLVFTKFGEGFYLRSSSEYQRFSVAAARISKLECFLHLNEAKAILVEDTIAETSTAANVDTIDEGEAADNDGENKLNVSGASMESNSSGNASLNRTVESVIQHLSQVVIDELKESEPCPTSPVSNGNIATPLNNS